MPTQLLVSVHTVTNLAGGASTVITHGLRAGDAPVTPTQVLCDRASPLVVTAANSTTFTVNNPTASPLTAVFRAEYDHSIHAVGATPTKWSGLPVTPGTPAAVYGQFYSMLDQTISNGTGISIGTLESGSGVGVSVVDPGTGPSRITVANAGVYAFSISLQMLKTSGGGHGTVTFWARKGGTDITDSASFVAVTNNQHVLPFVELIYPMNANEYIEWAANSDVANCRLEHENASVAPAVVRPAAPSVICGVKLVGT